MPSLIGAVMIQMVLASIFISVLGHTVTNAVQIGDYLRDHNGQIIKGLTQPEAEALCVQRGSRLPSIRELATLGANNGLVVFSEYMSIYKFEKKYPEEEFGETLFWAGTINGRKVDKFYFSIKDYKNDDKEATNLWSSSGEYDAYYFLIIGREIKENAYYFNELNGDMNFADRIEDRDLVGSARCVIKI